MPPPPPDASPAWRRARLTRIIEEVAARVPMDAAQGHLAGQLVVVQFLADDMVGRITAPGLALAERRLVARTADDLLRSVVRLERALERRQARVMPFRDVGAVDGFDLARWTAFGAAGSRSPPRRAPPPGGAAARTGADRGAGAGDARAGEAAGRGTAAVVGQAADAGSPDGRAGVGRAGVTLEQGDGWSLEVWPARAGTGVAPAPAAHDRLARPTATAGAATAERAATERPARGAWHERERRAGRGGRRPGPGASPGRAPACGARTRAGGPCLGLAMANGRCRMHGGASTGPRTAAGLARMVAAKTTHGRYAMSGAAQRQAQRYVRTLIVRTGLAVHGDAAAGVFAGRDGGAAGRGAGGVAGAEASLAGGVRGAARNNPMHLSAAGLGLGRRARAARARLGAGGGGADGAAAVALRGRAAERAAARAEAAAQAPWRAATPMDQITPSAIAVPQFSPSRARTVPPRWLCRCPRHPGAALGRRLQRRADRPRHWPPGGARDRADVRGRPRSGDSAATAARASRFANTWISSTTRRRWRWRR